MEKSNVCGNISTVNILIGTFGSGEDLDRCIWLIRKWDLKMNSYTYKCLLQAHLRSRSSERAFDVYSEMRRKGYKLDIFAYNMLLDGLSKDDMVAFCFYVDVFNVYSLLTLYGQLGNVNVLLCLFYICVYVCMRISLQKD